MKITREDTAPREVVLTIELESADLEPYLDRSYKRLVNKLQIPGFRRGKAPKFIVENHVGREALVRESLDYIVQESIDKAKKEEDLETFGEADVDVVEIDPLSLKATLPLEPVVDLGDFRILRLDPEPFEVTEEQIDRVLEQTRYDGAPWQPAERPVRFGDMLTLDVDGFIEGKRVADDKGVEFIPSGDSPLPFPGFSVYLEGMGKGESKEFTLKVPKDYADSSMADKECRFAVKVLEIKEKLLPELDDEFAKGVGDGYEGLEALRASILSNLTEHAERAAERAFQERSLEEVMKGASVEVSELTTTREIDHLLEERLQAMERRRVDVDTYLQSVGKSRDELRDEMRPEAQERLNRLLVLRSLAREEGIEVSPEEIDAELASLTSGSSQSAESLRQALSSESGRSSLGNSILTRKVLESLARIVRGETVEADSATGEEREATVSDAGVEESGLNLTGAGRTEDEGDRPNDD